MKSIERIHAERTADAICKVILEARGLPVKHCVTPDTRNAVSYMVSSCWTAADIAAASLSLTLATWATPIVRTINTNANGQDLFEVDMLIEAASLLKGGYKAMQADRKASLQANQEAIKTDHQSYQKAIKTLRGRTRK